MDFVLRLVLAVPLNERLPGQLLDAFETGRVTVYQHGLLRDVRDNLHAGRQERLTPRRRQRPNKVNEVQAFAGESRNGRPQSLNLGQRGI